MVVRSALMRAYSSDDYDWLNRANKKWRRDRETIQSKPEGRKAFDVRV